MDVRHAFAALLRDISESPFSPSVDGETHLILSLHFAMDAAPCRPSKKQQDSAINLPLSALNARPGSDDVCSFYEALFEARLLSEEKLLEHAELPFSRKNL